MHLLKIITLLILFQACGHKAINHKPDEAVNEDSQDEAENREFLLSDSISILSWKENNSDKIMTVRMTDQILLLDTFSSFGFEELDFDHDGFNDLMIIEIGGNHGTYYLYLWDPFQNIYREIEGYGVCPHSQALKLAPNLFYNVDLAGCYRDHESYLYKLEDFKISPIAYLYIQDCVSDKSPNDHYMEIRTSSCLDSMETGRLIERIDIIPQGTYEEIIENYWNENYQHLIK